MTPANPLEPLGRAIGTAFDRYVIPALLGSGMAIVSIGLAGWRNF